MLQTFSFLIASYLLNGCSIKQKRLSSSVIKENDSQVNIDSYFNRPEIKIISDFAVSSKIIAVTDSIHNVLDNTLLFKRNINYIEDYKNALPDIENEIKRCTKLKKLSPEYIYIDCGKKKEMKSVIPSSGYIRTNIILFNLKGEKKGIVEFKIKDNLFWSEKNINVIKTHKIALSPDSKFLVACYKNNDKNIYGTEINKWVTQTVVYSIQNYKAKPLLKINDYSKEKNKYFETQYIKLTNEYLYLFGVNWIKKTNKNCGTGLCPFERMQGEFGKDYVLGPREIIKYSLGNLNSNSKPLDKIKIDIFNKHFISGRIRSIADKKRSGRIDLENDTSEVWREMKKAGKITSDQIDEAGRAYSKILLRYKKKEEKMKSIRTSDYLSKRKIQGESDYNTQGVYGVKYDFYLSAVDVTDNYIVLKEKNYAEKRKNEKKGFEILTAFKIPSSKKKIELTDDTLDYTTHLGESKTVTSYITITANIAQCPSDKCNKKIREKDYIKRSNIMKSSPVLIKYYNNNNEDYLIYYKRDSTFGHSIEFDGLPINFDDDEKRTPIRNYKIASIRLSNRKTLKNFSITNDFELLALSYLGDFWIHIYRSFESKDKEGKPQLKWKFDSKINVRSNIIHLEFLDYKENNTKKQMLIVNAGNRYEGDNKTGIQIFKDL